MRTTLTLDPDVAAELKALRKKGRPFKEIVNEVLRLGLRELRKHPSPRPYRTKSWNMGLRPGLNLDNIAELIARIEGEDWK
jgi:hypothetical protein